MNLPLSFLLSSLILATVVGCQRGDGQTYANVKGKVTFNGTPIEKGHITFALEGRPPSTVDIVDGKFAGQAMVGSNKVSVSAKRKSAAAALPKSADTQVKGYQAKFKTNPGEVGGSPLDYDPTMVDYIPPEWGVQSKQMRVVESGGANDFEISIKGK
jgi:hypothetical protein